MDEVWKDVVGYEGLYQVSNTGRICRKASIVTDSIGRKHFFKERILKNNIGPHGYVYVSLSKDGKERSEFVHRIVANAFLKNDDISLKVEVNHLDENKENNRVDNLEWVTKSGNKKYGTFISRMLETRNRNCSYGIEKPVGKFSLEGTLLCTYRSASDAARMNSALVSNICSCCRECRGKRTYKGFIWRYL